MMVYGIQPLNSLQSRLGMGISLPGCNWTIFLSEVQIKLKIKIKILYTSDTTRHSP
jgi:hypothetical protein